MDSTYWVGRLTVEWFEVYGRDRWTNRQTKGKWTNREKEQNDGQTYRQTDK